MSKANQVVEQTNDDAELAALEAALEAEIEGTDADEATMEAAVAEIDLDEAKAEAYETQDGGDDIVEAKPKSKKKGKKKTAAKKAEKKAPRVTMAGAKKSVVAFSKMGANASGFALELADAELSDKERESKRDTFINSIDSMAVKVGEKAVNLVAYASNDAKLSAYTDIAMKFLVKQGTIVAKDLIEHLQDQKANGVKGYSVGTARSQAHQMFKLLPEFKIATLEGKEMTVNPDSLIVAKFKS